jgi:hypothetical protein
MFTDTDDIERELSAALGAEPAAGFERRVLESARARGRMQRMARTWLGVAAAVVLTAGVWALNSVTTPSPMQTTERVTTDADPQARIEAAPPGRPSARASAGAPIPLMPAARQRGGAPSVQASHGTPEPEVLVPANHLALINAFAREMNGGRVRLTEDTGADERLRILVVPEMIIQPIAIATLEAVSGPGPKGLHQ